jgi:Ca-activated chloride channel family protein
MKFIIFFLLLQFLLVHLSFSQKKTYDKTRILIIFDASQSMYGPWQTGTKFIIAKKVLSKIVDSLDSKSKLEVALRVYGHEHGVFSKTNRNCQDTKLEVPFAAKNATRIKKKLESIRPKGTTLIAYSLEQAAKDFPVDKNSKNVIVLISDGLEECDGDPCAVSLALQKKGIFLKPFIIGMGLGPEVGDAMRCIGNYFESNNEESFENVLKVVMSQALNNTTTQINLLDVNGQATETNVNMTLYDTKTGVLKYNFVHTMNDRGLPDTLNIDPVGRYNLVVHTIPPVSKDSIKLLPGKHNIIALDAAQGSLELKLNGINEYVSLKGVIRKKDNCKTLHVQEFQSTEKYLVGKYELELLTLPRISTEVEIKQSHTTKIEIQAPGVLNISSTTHYVGAIFRPYKGQNEWIYNLNPNVTNEKIIIQPGTYKIYYRLKNIRSAAFTIEKTFTIEQGKSTNISLN